MKHKYLATATCLAALLSQSVITGHAIADSAFARELARAEALEAASAERDVIVDRIVAAVAAEAEFRGFVGWDTELRSLLNSIDISRLVAADGASGYDAVVAAATNFTGSPQLDTAALTSSVMDQGAGGIAAVDSTTGLSFRAITPCRIVDTREVFSPLGTGEDRAFHVDDSAAVGTIASQGGNCVQTAPAAMAGIALNVTVVRPPGSGFLTLYPEGQPRPVASVINYAANDIIANSTVVSTPIASGADFRLYAFTQAQVVVDLLGYFVPSDTLRVVAGASSSANFDIVTAECPAGYQYIGSEFSWGLGNTGVWMTGVGQTQAANPSLPDPESARCRGNVTVGTQSILCYAVCQR